MASTDLTAPLTNSRGIPQAPFIENVEGFMQEKESDVVIKQLQEQYSKYKFMESQLSQKKFSIKTKLPDIKNALESVNFLIKKKGESFPTNFELTEGMFAKANVNNPSHVCLWLGANVMVEYTFDEAHALLSKNLEGALQQLKVLSEDLAFLKDQITTTEVNVARVYNYDVKSRRLRKQEEGPEDENESGAVETSSG